MDSDLHALLKQRNQYRKVVIALVLDDVSVVGRNALCELLKQVRDMIERLELVGDHPVELLQLDREAAQRQALAVPAGPVDGT